MKRVFLVLTLLDIICCAHAQQMDTLRNLALGSELIINDYNSGSGWGFWTGHNYLGRQQFAEKYYIEGDAKVLGVICHLTGKVTAGTPDSSAFNVWTVGDNHFPEELIASKPIQNVDLDISGEAYHVAFDQPVSVRDSFFVAFDLYDYSHHEHPDTIAILYGPDGSRDANDTFGRNVIQVHSHGTPVWRDFYTQNFTNISTHLAIFPIMEFVDKTVLATNYQDLEVSIFPNPPVDCIQVGSKEPIEQLTVYNMMGEMMLNIFPMGQEVSIDITQWRVGVYLVNGQTTNQAFKRRIVIR